jgi:hypothetical protein
LSEGFTLPAGSSPSFVAQSANPADITDHRIQEVVYVGARVSSDSVWADPSVFSGSDGHWRKYPGTATGHRIQERVLAECRFARRALAISE